MSWDIFQIVYRPAYSGVFLTQDKKMVPADAETIFHLFFAVRHDFRFLCRRSHGGL